MYIIGVRVSWSYDRYNSARIKWGMVVNRTRDIVRQFYAYCPDRELKQKANRWTIAFPYACKQHLRWKPKVSELQGTLLPKELDALNDSNHMPNYCMEQIAKCIQEAREKGLIDSFVGMTMDTNLTSFEDQIGAMERILKTPVPFGFVLHLRSMILLYLLLLPLYLMNKTDLFSIPLVATFGYILSGFEDLSQSIENPFRERWHCLPLQGICDTIKKNLIEIEVRDARQR
jgi:putative membrane protein